MLDLGIIRQANPGIFHYLPLGVRAVEKLIKVIDKEMHNIDAQKVIFSSLINAKLWRKTGRLDNSTELFKVADRHKSVYILSPVGNSLIFCINLHVFTEIINCRHMKKQLVIYWHQFPQSLTSSFHLDCTKSLASIGMK